MKALLKVTIALGAYVGFVAFGFNSVQIKRSELIAASPQHKALVDKVAPKKERAPASLE